MGGLRQGEGVGGGEGGRGHFHPAAIYCTVTWCFALKGLRTIILGDFQPSDKSHDGWSNHTEQKSPRPQPALTICPLEDPMREHVHSPGQGVASCVCTYEIQWTPSVTLC